jgi:colicin import membrane protein
MKKYSREIAGSLGIHVLLGIVLVIGGKCAPEISKPKPVTMVTAISLPMKKATELPQKASQVKSSQQKEIINNTQKPAPTPPPPKTDEMVIKKENKQEQPQEEKKEEEKEVPEKDEQQSQKEVRDELMRKLQREKLLEDLKSPEGPENREETSKEGTDDNTKTSRGFGPNDPALSAYISKSRKALIANWAPLPTILQEHPEYKVVILVIVDADGTMRNPKIIKKSGDASFDKAAIRAVHKTGKLPPPPDGWKESAAKGIKITLAAKDK